MKNTVFPHKFWRPFLDCTPQLFLRPQYVWFPVHLKGLLIPLWYETLVVNWQNWLFTLFHQSRSVLSPNPINNIPALVHIMAWRRVGDNPLFEPMIVSLLTHICVTRPQWVKSVRFIIFRRICTIWSGHEFGLRFGLEKAKIMAKFKIDGLIWGQAFN